VLAPLPPLVSIEHYTLNLTTARAFSERMARLSINVAVVDDQDIILMGVQHSLLQIPQLNFLGGFTTLEQFCKSSASRKANVVLLDDSLPDLQILQSIQIIQEHTPKAAILLLGSQLTARGIHEALDAGASGVVCKNDPIQDTLLIAIQRAHAGKTYMSTNAGLIALNYISLPGITNRLYDVLSLTAKGYEVADIMCTLGISQKAVYQRTKLLCEILDVKTNKQLIAKAIQLGLIKAEE
jgi:two-component system nitrate/nitrite response regulator NarL